MAKDKSRPPEAARDIAEPVRKAIRLLLKQRISACENVGDEFKRLAVALKKKPKTVQSLLYEGKGGFDLMIAALIVSYDLNDERIEKFFEDLKLHLKKISPASQADQNWSELDSIMSEGEKLHWTEAMRAIHKIELSLQKSVRLR